MKNIYTFSTRFALAVLVILTAFGCKKNDAAPSFSIDSASSIYFEPSQTLTIGFNTTAIKKVVATETPDGWTVIINNTKSMTITAVDSKGDGAKSGTLTLKATTDSNGSISKSVTVNLVDPTDLSTAGTANCYIVPTAAARYSINATVKGSSNEAITPADCKLVWSAPAGAVKFVQSNNGQLSFSTNDIFGNALVAAVDAKDNILWSWHIWVTDYNPSSDAQTYSDGTVMMSRNLGSFANSNSADSMSWRSCGMYYQWGRKEPFVGSKYYTTAVNQSMYNADGKWTPIVVKSTTAKIGTEDYASANPLTFIAGVESTSYDWLYASRNNTLWSSTKTVNDPCPAGWRVGSIQTYKAFSKSGASTETPAEFNVDGAYNNGWNFIYNGSESTLFIAAGRRSFVDGAFTNVDATGYNTLGFYWTLSTDGDSASALSFTDKSLGIGTSAYRANAMPVRCVKE